MRTRHALAFTSISSIALIAAASYRAHAEEGAKSAGDIVVQDGSGAPLGRLVTLTMVSSVPKTVVVRTSFGYLVEFDIASAAPVDHQAGSKPSRVFVYSSSDCSGQAYLESSNSLGGLKGFAGFHSQGPAAGRYVVVTGPLTSLDIHSAGSPASCMPSRNPGPFSGSGVDMSPPVAPVKALVAGELGLPSKIKAPLSIQ